MIFFKSFFLIFKFHVQFFCLNYSPLSNEFLFNCLSQLNSDSLFFYLVGKIYFQNAHYFSNLFFYVDVEMFNL